MDQDQISVELSGAPENDQGDASGNLALGCYTKSVTAHVHTGKRVTVPQERAAVVQKRFVTVAGVRMLCCTEMSDVFIRLITSINIDNIGHITDFIQPQVLCKKSRFGTSSCMRSNHRLHVFNITITVTFSRTEALIVAVAVARTT